MQWRKSSFCGTDHVTEQCVEVAPASQGAVIYLKDWEGDLVSYSREEFRAFVLGVKAGEFDDLT